MPDLTGLAEVGGWVFSSAVLFTVLTLLVTGKLVAGPSYAREAKRSDAQDDRLDKLTETVRELTGYVKALSSLQERK